MLRTVHSNGLKGPDDGGRPIIIFRMSGKWLLALIAVAFPLTSVVFVVATSLYKDFEEVSITGCHVCIN